MTTHSVAALPATIGGRYVLRSELGRGGMATVHRAHDEALDREVAIKVLHAHLATDVTFLERFRREARAAAALSHPNVVAVHDWGESKDGAWLVLELVEGPTLRQVLHELGPLEPAEAAGILLPVSEGIAAAHRSGLVHRDIKPENVLIGDDGSVQITDFGLARAVASASVTFGSGVLVGSPHYMSPEAVRGQPLDPRADVYALGIVLFECLTGRPPHAEDSAWSTAMAHAQRPVPRPSSFVEGLDPALDEVVAWATSIDPDHRYEDATDFARALRNAVDDVTPVEQLLIHLAPTDPSDVAGATAVIDRSTSTTSPRQPARRRGRVRGLLLVALLAVVVVGAGLFGNQLWSTYFAPLLEVPPVVGTELTAATETLRDAGFRVDVADATVHDRSVPEGHVLFADPSDEARRGTTVSLVVSAGPRQVDVVPVEGLTGAVAEQRLRSAGLDVVVVRRHHDQVQTGNAIGTVPASGQLDEGSRITLLVSDGPAPREVPDLVGSPYPDLLDDLRAQGLEANVVERRHDVAPEGTVIEQSPVVGEKVDHGTTIELVVSDGPRPVEVPSVRGSQVAAATQQLEDLGLVVEVERRGGLGSYLNPGRVFDQDPGPGSVRREGDTIVLYAYEG
ncbi:MAG: PASTA domain-containing protein [Nitriliruptoraceae bacterium]